MELQNGRTCKGLYLPSGKQFEVATTIKDMELNHFCKGRGLSPTLPGDVHMKRALSAKGSPILSQNCRAEVMAQTMLSIGGRLEGIGRIRNLITILSSRLTLA